MKRVAIGLILCATVIGVVAVATVTTADRPARTSSPAPGAAAADRPYAPGSVPPGYYTYEEAKAAGIDVPLLSEIDLPICDSTTPDPGFASGEDSNAVIEAAEPKHREDGSPGRCMADPRLGVYVVGGPIKGMPPGE
jgi:hypothetical protein